MDVYNTFICITFKNNIKNNYKQLFAKKINPNKFNINAEYHVFTHVIFNNEKNKYPVIENIYSQLKNKYKNKKMKQLILINDENKIINNINNILNAQKQLLVWNNFYKNTDTNFRKVESKIYTYFYCKKNNIKTPEIFFIKENNKILKNDNTVFNKNYFVLKVDNQASCRGIFIIKKSENKYINLLNDKIYYKECLKKVINNNKDVLIEEYLKSNHLIPYDFKVATVGHVPVLCNIISRNEPKIQLAMYSFIDNKFINHDDFFAEKTHYECTEIFQKSISFPLNKLKNFATSTSKKMKFPYYHTIDCYIVNNEIYLGEITQTPGHVFFSKLQTKWLNILNPLIRVNMIKK